ncbi:hypothetical protein [Streptomyces sp. B1-3]|uniref:hypothetical protein n=1 Tax=Streptomyces sp. B1-3 TaxID=3141453 RepID=UPI003D28B4FF
MARLRVLLSAQRRRLAEFEAAVPESTTHLRLLVRGIASAKAAIAGLTEAIAAAEAAGTGPARPKRRAGP